MSVFNDLVLLRAFVCIVECGSISAAARQLRLTQPTLSRYLRALEQQSGSVLLYRDTHRMQLSQAGHQLLADAKSLIALADEAEQRLQGEQGAMAGTIRLFSTIDFGQSIVSRLIASFISLHPGVRLELSYTNRPLRMIEEGCDVGIIVGEITDDTVVARYLGEVRRYLVAAPEYINQRPTIRTPTDLESWQWVTLSSPQFDGGQEIRLYGLEQATWQAQVIPVVMTEGITSLRELLRMGLGVGVLPEWLAAEDIVSGKLVYVLPDWQAKPLSAHIIFPVQRHLPLRVRTFIAFAQTYMNTALKA